jgi:hypothetical protein
VNVVPGVNADVANRGPELWFNPVAFDQPADFTLGNGPRTHPYLLTPGFQNYDLTVNKRMTLGTDRALEFSLAGFNFINHANWNDPTRSSVPGPAQRERQNYQLFGGALFSSAGSADGTMSGFGCCSLAASPPGRRRRQGGRGAIGVSLDRAQTGEATDADETPECPVAGPP